MKVGEQHEKFHGILTRAAWTVTRREFLYIHINYESGACVNLYTVPTKWGVINLGENGQSSDAYISSLKRENSLRGEEKICSEINTTALRFSIRFISACVRRQCNETIGKRIARHDTLELSLRRNDSIVNTCSYKNRESVRCRRIDNLGSRRVLMRRCLSAVLFPVHSSCGD